jgi:hypothetical protein
VDPPATPRTAASQIDAAFRLSVRTAAACRLFPLGETLPSTDFRWELPPFVQSLRKYYGLIHVHARRAAFSLPEPTRHTGPGMDETSQVPRKECLHVHKVSDCARFFSCKPFAMR